MIRGIVEMFEESCLGEAEFKRAKFPREELDDICSLRRWDKKAINAVDDAIGTEL